MPNSIAIDDPWTTIRVATSTKTDFDIARARFQLDHPDRNVKDDNAFLKILLEGIRHV